MNDYQRENLVGWGSFAASYAIWRNRTSAGEAVVNDGLVQGAIEAEHTRYVVTQKTGDARLGRRAGMEAGARVMGWWFLMFGAPFALFLTGAIVFGRSESAGTIGLFLIAACFILFCVIGRFYVRTHRRNYYVRNQGLPSERELNVTGYWQVEPDVWFNPITDAVLHGHAYNGREVRAEVDAYQAESQQIRALYRSMKNR